MSAASRMSPVWVSTILIFVVGAFGLAVQWLLAPRLEAVNDIYQADKRFAWLSTIQAGPGREQCVDTEKSDAAGDNRFAMTMICEYLGPKGDERTAVRLTTRGYNGPIALAVVLDENSFQHLGVLEHQETPGYGADLLAGSGEQLRELALSATPLSTHDAVSGATVTANAVARSLRWLKFRVQAK